LAQKRVLVQDRPAVEVLARVDTICVDKTGTLTEPGMRVHQVVPVGSGVDTDSSVLAGILGAVGSGEANPNPTLQAIADEFPDPSWPVVSAVPFSSARKWSAVDLGSHGSWVLGAPEIVGAQAAADVRRQADELAATGARVVLLARAETVPQPDDALVDLQPVALVVISQLLRADAPETVAYFLEQDVTVKVISGDNAVTVGAIAGQAGVPGADHPVDARTLSDDPQELAAPVSEANVFGRVTPLQKQQMVEALHLRDSTVAMTGDGVNDVLALKKADLGIAMGSGSGATRAVAQLVLLDDQWSVMPSVVAEGRRVLGNIERVADVFLTKTSYSVVFSLFTGLFAVAFPFLPRHLTLVSALTIGIPGFFLALMPNTERFRPGFLRRVLLFAIPSGVICAAASLVSYSVALNVGEPLANAQAAASVTLFIVAAGVLLMSARPLNALRLGIVGTMVAIFVAVLYVPFLSEFFALTLGPEKYTLVAIGSGLVGVVLVWAAALVTDRWRRA